MATSRVEAVIFYELTPIAVFNGAFREGGQGNFVFAVHLLLLGLLLLLLRSVCDSFIYDPATPTHLMSPFVRVSPVG